MIKLKSVSILCFAFIVDGYSTAHGAEWLSIPTGSAELANNGFLPISSVVLPQSDDSDTITIIVFWANRSTGEVRRCIQFVGRFAQPIGREVCFAPQ
ncbi:hypothetical protein [Wenxinia marina]|uniref:hypothetical protein n=1 Tax=Wenxinia marina TaxID=390641 RepID=UPI0012E08F76|nr:hypothetical protein [Wenxinia marina]